MGWRGKILVASRSVGPAGACGGCRVHLGGQYVGRKSTCRLVGGRPRFRAARSGSYQRPPLANPIPQIGHPNEGHQVRSCFRPLPAMATAAAALSLLPVSLRRPLTSFSKKVALRLERIHPLVHVCLSKLRHPFAKIASWWTSYNLRLHSVLCDRRRSLGFDHKFVGFDKLGSQIFCRHDGVRAWFEDQLRSSFSESFC